MTFSCANLLALRRAAAVAVAAGLFTAAMASQAAGFKEGAYADALGSTPVVCVGAQQLASLTAQAWLAAMQQRGKDCAVTESARPMPGLETWAASCRAAPGGRAAAGAGPSVYAFSVLADGERLIIDSRLTSATGELAMKKAFAGSHQGACAAGIPALDAWAYLDASHGEPASATAGARKAVAIALVRCGNVFNGLAPTVPTARQEGMRSAAAALLEAAVALYPGDAGFHVEALKQSAPQVAAEIVGASPETKFALYQACSPYLAPDGVERAVQNYREPEAAGTPAR